MARTKSRPGPKPRYGKRRDYHILLPSEPIAGEAMSLSDAFEQAAKAYEGVLRKQAEEMGQRQKETSGIIAYISFVLRERPEIRARLLGHSSSSD